MTQIPNRREFLKHSMSGTLALGLAATASTLPILSRGAETISTPLDPKPVKDEAEFRLGVMGPAMLSLETSKIAVEKAVNANAKEFANFELGEAIAVTTVLKELGTSVPPMDEKAKTTLASMTAAAAGPEFDKTYINAQLENHVFLLKHASDFLAHSPKKADAAEKHAQQLAILMSAVFKEHVLITTRILKELQG